MRGQRGERARPTHTPLATQRDQNTLTRIAPCEQRYRQREDRDEAKDGVEHDEQTLLDRSGSHGGEQPQAEARERDHHGQHPILASYRLTGIAVEHQRAVVRQHQSPDVAG